MKTKTIKAIALTTILMGSSISAFASWQMVAPTTVGGSQSPFFQTTNQDPAFTGAFAAYTQDSSASDNPFGYTSEASQAGSQEFAGSFGPSTSQAYVLHVYPGTLKSNLERIMKKQQPWKLLWNSKYDYRVISDATVRGKNFAEALNKLLLNYPLEAVFYNQNDIMTIVSRKA